MLMMVGVGNAVVAGDGCRLLLLLLFVVGVILVVDIDVVVNICCDCWLLCNWCCWSY